MSTDDGLRAHLDEVDTNAFPRVASYLAQLPEGLASFPECTAKGALFRSASSSMPLPAVSPGAIPAALLERVAQPPRSSEWIPEVVLMAYNMAYADARHLTDAQFLDLMLQTNRKTFAGPIYRALLSLASPGLLIAAGSAHWGSMHRGSTLSIERSSPSEVEAMLRFPRRLFTRLMVEDFARAIQAALEASRAKNARVEVASYQEDQARYIARW